MALSDQDREWVRAIVKEAALESLNGARERTYSAIAEHQKSCTFKLQSKAVILGVAVGAALGGAGLTALIGKLAHFL